MLSSRCWWKRGNSLNTSNQSLKSMTTEKSLSANGIGSVASDQIVELSPAELGVLTMFRKIGLLSAV